MMRNDAGSQVVCTPIDQHGFRIAPCAFANERPFSHHGMPKLLITVVRLGVEIHLDRIRVYFVEWTCTRKMDSLSEISTFLAVKRTLYSKRKGVCANQ